MRLRDSLVRRRNACINQVHGFMLEFGITYPKGRKTILRLPAILESIESELPASMVQVLYRIYDEYRFITQQITDLETEMSELVAADDRGRRLLDVPGVGLITTSCLLTWVGDGKQFKSARDLAAWIGWVPKQHSTGVRPLCWALENEAIIDYVRT